MLLQKYDEREAGEMLGQFSMTMYSHLYAMKFVSNIHKIIWMSGFFQRLHLQNLESQRLSPHTECVQVFILLNTSPVLTQLKEGMAAVSSQSHWGLSHPSEAVLQEAP